MVAPTTGQNKCDFPLVFYGNVGRLLPFLRYSRNGLAGRLQPLSNSD